MAAVASRVQGEMARVDAEPRLVKKIAQLTKVRLLCRIELLVWETERGRTTLLSLWCALYAK